MGENSKIEWCDHTFNSWWGCTPVSEACENCYAENTAKRCGLDCFGKGKPRRTFGKDHWVEPLKWNRKALKLGVKYKVFAGSMCDVFDEESPEGARNALFGMILNTPNLIWILCTKRPQNIPGMVPSYWMQNGFPENIWMLVTAENQKRADERIPLVLKVPAKVRGISIEPMLSEIHVEQALSYNKDDLDPEDSGGKYLASLKGIDWVIVGGESGPKARPMNPNWVRSVRDQCQAAGIPFFMKQWGEWLSFSSNYPGIEWSKEGTGEIISVAVDGRRYREVRCDEDDENIIYVRVGKANAGRMIDGATWSQFPEVK